MVTPSSPIVSKNDPHPNDSPEQLQKRLGEILIEFGWVRESDITEALEEAHKTGQYLGSILVRQNKITKEQLGKALANQFNIQYVSLANMEIDKSLFTLLPEPFMRENQVLPIAKEGGRLVVAMVDPRNRRVHDEITFITGMRPQALVTTALEFSDTFSRLAQQSSANNLIDEINVISQESSESREDQIRQQQQAELLDNTHPLVKLVNSVIEEGIEKNASDIHVEARERGCVIRFRIDGILNTMLEIPPNMEGTFMTRIKVMARMDISEHRRPQDGRIGLNYKGIEYNLRVNTMPIGEGREKIVIRILRPSQNITDFEDLGLSSADIRRIETLYKAPYGIVLVCGPTGSGKTTTLYTVLHKINDQVRNILTVEDPIELRIDGINQSQVNPKADYTFNTALRALLRQDPDVIMVGEIRDYETLEAAIHASLTGHLVFSTIHANTAAGTVTRLVEIGADPILICSTLLGVINQRLVRLLCTQCRKAYSAPDEEKLLIFPKRPEHLEKPLTLYQAQGCSFCNDTGYIGRMGLYEILTVDRKIRQLVSDRRPDNEIEDAAVAAGMKNLAICGLEALLSGKTSLEEIIRVLGPNLGRSF